MADGSGRTSWHQPLLRLGLVELCAGLVALALVGTRHRQAPRWARISQSMLAGITVAADSSTPGNMLYIAAALKTEIFIGAGARCH